MFRGEYKVKLDGEHRLVLPRKFIGQLLADEKFGGDSKNICLMRGPKECVLLFSEKYWAQLKSELNSMPPDDPMVPLVKSYLVNDSCILDAKNRVTIPKRLLEYAGIKKQATVIGAGLWIEVWDSEKYLEYMDSMMHTESLFE